MTEFVINVLASNGKYLPLLLPILSMFSGFYLLTALLIADMLLINPGLKLLTSLLGLQTKRPMCANLSTYRCYGMPSGHVEVHFIFLAYLIAHIYFLYSHQLAYTHQIPLLVGILIMTAIVSWQRVYTMRHSISQVCVGALIGTILGAGYYIFIQNQITSVIKRIA